MQVDCSSSRPDLDSRANIEAFVDEFYRRLLADPELAVIFLDIARIDLAEHLPHIKNYWCKLLLGETGYRRHTLELHRRVHARRALRREDFERWLGHFNAALDGRFAGARSERARQLAATIADNMHTALTRCPAEPKSET